MVELPRTAEAPRGASVYVHDTAGARVGHADRATGGSGGTSAACGSIAGAYFGLYHHEKHMLGQEYQNWVAFGTVRPAYIGGLDGVPVILVYEQPAIARGARSAPP